MTFRVIEGGGAPTLPRAGSIEEARTTIIDRVAAAIWAFQDETPEPAYATWEEMKAIAATDPSRARLVRIALSQARGAIAAMRSYCPPGYGPEAELAIFAGQDLDAEEVADASAAFDHYIDEVLK